MDVQSVETKAVTTLYFAGLLCPEETEACIRAYKMWMLDQFGCRVALKSPAHITLIPPFSVSQEEEALLLETLMNFSSDLPVLMIQLNGFNHFGKRVIYAAVNENPGLQVLKMQIMSWFRSQLGDRIPADNHPFHPHVSIANRDLSKNDFETAWAYFNSLSFHAAFHANTLSLLRLTDGKWMTAGEKKWC